MILELKLVIDLDKSVALDLVKLLSPYQKPGYTEPLELTIDMSKCTWIHPKELAMLTNFILYMKERGNQFSFEVIEPIDYRVATYVARMNFYQLIGQASWERFQRRNPAGRFLELTPVTSETANKCVNHFIEILRRQDTIEEYVLQAFLYALFEIVDNCNSHSQTVSPAIFTAQSYSDHIVFCMNDNGIGIPESLRTNEKFANKTNQQALQCCIQQGITRDNGSGLVGKGQGLFIASEIIKATSGFLDICSLNSCLRVNEERIWCKEFNDLWWQGTIVYGVIYKNSRLNKEKLDNIFEGNLASCIEDAYYDTIEKPGKITRLW